MNNKIKILSVIVLLLFAGMFAMPFLTHISCDMAECGESSNTCNMNMVVDNCCESMTECTITPFQPVTSAPLNKVELQQELTIDYNFSYFDILNISEEHSRLTVVDKLCSSEVHSGFNTPLLV